MQKNISNLKRKLEESGTKFLDLKYASLTGAMHHITVPLNRFEAPTYTDFAVGSRKTAVRLPKYLKNNKMMEIEYRIPDATANPYLATSAILLAGIDGIENRFKVDRREKLPTNVYEAINALKQDYTFLLRGSVCTEDLIESWIEVKTKECEEIHLRPHPDEFTLYFGI